MALLWETLATRETTLLRQSLAHRFAIAPGCAWVNYVRSHDDIGWTFDDADAGVVGKNGFDHRRFLNAFYTGRFPGTFARGVPFQENPRTGDARISGTAASLAGLEKALREEGPAEVDLALSRIALLYGITLLIGGIPLIYLGDELGTLNDYGYLEDPAHAGDSRWVHRPRHDPAAFGRRHDPSGIEGRLSGHLRDLIRLRMGTPVFAGTETDIVDPGNDHVFGFVRRAGGDRVLVLANVTEQPQRVSANVVRLASGAADLIDLVTGAAVSSAAELVLDPYRLAVLRPVRPAE